MKTKTNQPRCHAAIYHRDTYRRTGRGPTGFQLHYTYNQCSRKATHGKWCWQHANSTHKEHQHPQEFT